MIRFFVAWAVLSVLVSLVVGAMMRGSNTEPWPEDYQRPEDE